MNPGVADGTIPGTIPDAAARPQRWRMNETMNENSVFGPIPQPILR